MKLFDKTYMKFCSKHGISYLFFRTCKECEFDKKNPQLKEPYLSNLIRKY